MDVMSTEIISEAQSEELEPMADAMSGVIGMRLGKYLLEHVEANNLGWVFNADTDFTLPEIGKRRPDVAFCTFETLPELPRTVVPVPPDLAVEVASSRDEIDDTDKKLREYQQVKIRLVWVIRPVRQVIEVYRDGKAVGLLDADGVLEGGEVIPGFTLPIKQLFSFPKRL